MVSARKTGPLEDLLLEWYDARWDRRREPPPSSIRRCEEEDENPEGPCYGRGRLYNGPDACDPCRERLARFNRIKGMAARIRGIETRMMGHAARVKAAERREK